jgi:hypothetical protein
MRTGYSFVSGKVSDDNLLKWSQRQFFDIQIQFELHLKYETNQSAISKSLSRTPLVARGS